PGADDRLDELLVVEVAAGDVGGMAPAAGRFGDRAGERAALVERRAVLAPRPVARFTPDVGEARARVRDVGGTTRLEVAGDVAADARGVLVAADALQRGEGARVLGRLPERERRRVASAAGGGPGVVAARGRRGRARRRFGTRRLGSDADRLARGRALLALPVVRVDEDRDARLV